MIPLGDSTVILPHVQGRAVRSGGFSLTLLQTTPQLSAVCVASPLHSTPSPVLQRLNSRSKRRIRSVSSLCRETGGQGDQKLSKRRSQGDLGIESKDVSTMSPQQISYPNCLITITSEKELMSPSVEMKKDQSADTSSNSSSQEDSRASSLSESKNIPKAKTKKEKAHSRTSKPSNKNKSKKSSKSRKSCKRRNSNKCSSKVPSVFERLTNSTFRNENHSHKEKSKGLPHSKKGDTTIFCRNQPCGTLLEIKRLQATYHPKQNTKPKTFLLLPKVPKFTCTKKDSPRTIAKPEHEKTNLNSCNSTFISPRQKSLDVDINNKQNIVGCKKIYLSEMQSKAIGGVPSAPPGTPSPDQLKKVEYVPSLMDVKSQRAVKSKLEKIVHKLRIEEQHRKENSIKQDQKKLKESLIQLKQRQRLEIYALNKVMTELENENFKNFMEKKETVSLGV